jgi:uroporphyrinogen-III synthase
LPQSEIASEELPDGLTDMNAAVKKVTVYKTIDIEPAPVDFDYIDRILFTSGSTVRAFVKYFGKVPENIISYGLGQPTVNEAKKHNINAEIVPS